ncbi:serine hydrolase [Streptomyces sp. AM 4-1-1]|uniref:serine hydrolase domain-containing protein n=1 Tax=Streptomyces sp. AM 4-1-1 TaxID=3028710 RepID=UPI0023B9BFAC|nr:serine hydrolase domain-containing protein [Streptomyces sp. AM 4-1-1]WEH35836.1 serine hydrolase [Streptomyces sp. AM 4-1-1]
MTADDTAPGAGRALRSGAPAPPRPGPAAPPAHIHARRAGTRIAERLADAADALGAPDIVLAVSRRGHRTVHCGGVAQPPRGVPRDQWRYEIGSASKTFTGLLLADLVAAGRFAYDDVAATRLAPHRPAGPPGNPATLLHLITHTSGLPAFPADFYPQALPHWSTAPYAGYSAERVVAAYLRARPRHRPGTRWHYSNFGASVLGHTLAAATETPWEDLIGHHVLAPLGLTGVRLHPCAERPATPTSPSAPTSGHPFAPAPTPAPGADTSHAAEAHASAEAIADARGYRRDGVTPVPALRMGGFQAAGAVRATPGDLLSYLEAHLDPSRTPLSAALEAVRRPLLRRGRGHRHVHTLTWFQHLSSRGPLYFHGGATPGQQAFLGFRPATGTAVVALATRRVSLRDPFIATAYALLDEME